MYFSLINAHEKELPLYLESIGRQNDQEDIVRPQGFPYHQLFLITHGSGMLAAPSLSTPLKAGDCLFIRKNTAHSYHAVDRPFTTRWISFDGSSVESLINYFQLQDIHFFVDADLPGLRLLHEELLDTIAHNGDADQLSVLLYQTFFSFARGRRHASQTRSEALQTARHFIKTHYQEDLTLSTIADTAGMNRYSFCKAFAAAYNMKAFEYLIRVRLQEAKYLLLSDKAMSVREVSERVGFHDSGYFGRMFKRYEGITPLGFRKRWER